ncbi:MAG TPA: SCO family protein [Bdellovibrionota bacterium]|jgi:protein SCO1/2|nr:SCO family protein [Bdellovibrionota bacterium]
MLKLFAMSSTPDPKSGVQMKQGPSIFSHPLFWVVTILALFSIPLVASLRSPPIDVPPVLGQMNDFELTSQEGRKITRKDFHGSVLVVNFIFSKCPDVCPLLNKQMSEIQARLKGTAKAIQLVSISVDPQNDTPDVLRKYSAQFNADPRLWTFLSGPLDKILKVVVDDFKQALDGQKLTTLEDRMDGMMEITHSEKFVLVDQSGQIRAYMTANSPEDVNKILKKVAILANTEPSAAPAAR